MRVTKVEEKRDNLRGLIEAEDVSGIARELFSGGDTLADIYAGLDIEETCTTFLKKNIYCVLLKRRGKPVLLKMSDRISGKNEILIKIAVLYQYLTNFDYACDLFFGTSVTLKSTPMWFANIILNHVSKN